MKNPSFHQKAQNVLLVLIGIAAAFIAFLDALSLLDKDGWFKSHLLAMNLLLLGMLLTYSSAKEDKDQERHDEILGSIILDRITSDVKNLLERTWANRENDINKLFDDIKEQLKLGNIKTQKDLQNYLAIKFDEMKRGVYFGAATTLPWDFTLHAINYDRVFIYHPCIPNGQRLWDHSDFNGVMRERTGTWVWINDHASNQLRTLFPNLGTNGTQRYTKLHYRDFPELKAIVTVESHINIITNLPPVP